MCVQNFDDSRGPAIRITYRISLRSSSLWEPRYPLPRVVIIKLNQKKLDKKKNTFNDPAAVSTTATLLRLLLLLETTI